MRAGTRLTQIRSIGAARLIITAQEQNPDTGATFGPLIIHDMQGRIIARFATHHQDLTRAHMDAFLYARRAAHEKPMRTQDHIQTVYDNPTDPVTAYIATCDLNDEEARECAAMCARWTAERAPTRVDLHRWIRGQLTRETYTVTHDPGITTAQLKSRKVTGSEED